MSRSVCADTKTAFAPAGSPLDLLRRRSMQVFGVSVGLFGPLWAVLKNWADQRASVRDLRRMTDRQLRDAGIARHDITRIVDRMAAERNRQH